MGHDHLSDGLNEYLPLREVVFRTLRNAIITGELAPGERLMEISLSQKLGVSRTPVREAIRKLELEGLVVMIPRRGARVARITEKGLRDVIEIRSVLEEFAAGLASQRIQGEQIREMREIHQDFIKAVDSGDILRMVDVDEAFHDAIFRATMNERLISIIAGLREQFYRYRLEYIRDIREHSMLILEHEQLMDAIFHHNEAAARRIMRTHLENQKKRILEIINQ